MKDIIVHRLLSHSKVNTHSTFASLWYMVKTLVYHYCM